MRVIDLKNILNRALNNLEDYDDNAVIDCRPNTYGCQMPFVATRSGYISLDDIEVEENEEFYESNGNDADKEEFCIKKCGEPSSFEDDTWQCEDFWDKLHNQKLESAFDSYMTELYPGGLDLTTFNDILRFDGDDVIESIGGTVEESHRPIRRKQKVVSESKSLQRELFEYMEAWISEQNSNDNPKFNDESLQLYLNNEDESIRPYNETAEGLIEEYKDVASEKLLGALESFLDETQVPSMFSDMFRDVFERACEVVAASLEFPGY